MSEVENSFGRSASECASSSALMDLEEQHGRASRFAAIDTTLTGLVTRSARGDRVVRIIRGDRQDRAEVIGVPDSLRTTMVEAFQLESQQSRGAWFLPEAVPLKVGVINFASYFREHPRYAHRLAAEDKGKVALTESPDAMVIWSALEPIFSALLQPITLRVEQSGLLEKQEFLESWSSIDEFLKDLQLDLAASLRPFEWGGDWTKFSAEQQIATKASLVAAIVERVDLSVLRRYRARATRALIAKYYSKAKKGRAKRRQVVTKEHWHTLAAFFAGDWLAFVDYLGEQPHEEERIVTALPETKIVVGGKEKAAAIAAKRGLPVEEVERVLGALWENAGGDSPIRQRVDTLANYWREFDAIHARHTPGMGSLWGLVQEGGGGELEPQPWTPYRPGLFRQLLSPTVGTAIDRLWGTTVLPKWPERIVTQPFAHSAMASALGPALKFWHGCALTAWFVCEGPMSRTDIPGLARYYRHELGELEEMGCPVHPQLFEELKNVQLGPEQPIYESPAQAIDVGMGISFTVRGSSRSRRDGFVQLRDVITRHRRWWSEQLFDRYLRGLWESLLKATGRQFHLMTEEKGKPPTLKQFAKHAVPPAQSWFGGDIGLVYAALGQKMTGTVEQQLLMPKDTVRFAAMVFEALGGTPFERKTVVTSPEQGRAEAEAQEKERKLRRLSAECVWYVQLMEALGRVPTLKEFGPKFEWLSQVLASNVDDAWAIYERAISGVLVQLR